MVNVLSGTVVFLGMNICRLWVSAINHDWSVFSTGGVHMFISLTFHRSILTPVFQCFYQTANACGLENVCVLSGWNGSTVGEGDVAAWMCRFSRLSSNLQALISCESEGMSLTGFPWHCQLLYSPRHHSFMLQSVLSGSPSPREAQFYLIVVPEPWSWTQTSDVLVSVENMKLTWSGSSCRVFCVDSSVGWPE